MAGEEMIDAEIPLIRIENTVVHIYKVVGQSRLIWQRPQLVSQVERRCIETAGGNGVTREWRSAVDGIAACITRARAAGCVLQAMARNIGRCEQRQARRWSSLGG